VRGFGEEKKKEKEGIKISEGPGRYNQGN